MSIFKGSRPIPPLPPVQPLAPIPKGIDQGVSQIRRSRERVRRASGSRPIKTSALGLFGPAANGQQKTLLGV